MGHLKSEIKLQLKAPKRSTFGVEAAAFESVLDGGIAGMHFGADAADAALFGIFEKRRDEAAPHTLSAPLRRHEKRNDVHRFSAKLRAPLVRCVGVAAKPAFVFGDDNKPTVSGIHDVLENPARVRRRSFGADVRQQLSRKLAKLIHVLRGGCTNLKRPYAHARYPGSHKHIVISNSEFRKFDFRRYSVSQSTMSRVSKLTRSFAFALGFTLVLIFSAATIPWTHQQPRAAAPDIQVSADQFGRYIEQWSEPEGYFDSDNFISNETSYLHVIDELKNRVRPGGVYLGVGPDQNFSYIVHTRPMLAIITDIRRQNMLQHLWLKALFALASNRAEYLSLLVSRQTPRVKPDATLEQIIDAVRTAPTNAPLFEKNLAAVKGLLVDKYKLKLSSDDLSKIEYVYNTFWHENLGLRFSSIGRGNALMYPTFEEMLLETDRKGRQQNFLSSEDLFQWMKRFEAENRLIPIVGDFAGSYALRTVGGFLKANGLRLSTFYTSNVEFYLFDRLPQWTRFVVNLRTIPLADDAVFIRSYFGNGRRHPLNMPGHRSTSLIKPIGTFFADYDARRIVEYWDVVKP